jgi:hypothetical protein
MTKLKVAILGTVAAAALAAPLIYQHESLSKLREENRVLQEQQSQVAQLAAENQRLLNLVTTAVNPQALPQDRELLKLRAEVALLRQQSKELAQLREQNRQLQAQQVPTLQQGPAPFQRTLTAEDARDVCVNHLRQIDGAVQQCALENKLSDRDVVTLEQIAPYLKDADSVLRCPSGGTYTFGPIASAPTCPIPGHALPIPGSEGK